jgi:glycosyltransferase involved in cell wall biosynthesis
MVEVFSCNAPYNEGGLGRFLASLVEEARSRGQLGCYYSTDVRPNDPAGRKISLQRFSWLFRSPPLRYSHAWRDHLASELFDRAVAGELPRASVFFGFAGKALRSFRQARRLGFERLVLESATSHVENVMRQHRLAYAKYPFEEGWLNRAQYTKVVREYDEADAIYVSSAYSRQSFLQAGVPEAKLRHRFQPVAVRFAPPAVASAPECFRLVFVGRLQVTKGLAVLLEAFARVDDPNARLTLVGGCATGGMERYLRRRLKEDRRIVIRPGDPLPHLHRAHALVHPTFEDGLGLAPLEALACGVPVIVTEDTGMKEFVVPGRNGYILPTGDVDALTECLRSIRANPLRGSFTPFRRQGDVEAPAVPDN